ncbi:MAG: tetratricopeptide repeat protein [Desulfobacteraceae bacterium]|nr:tetratricopeptide repeat protein [Desulfobacteraceae bacterium]
MPFSLEKEALIVSGITKDDLIASYLSKLDKLHQQFIHEINLIGDPLTTAKALFDWLWIKKPARYAPHGHFRLHHVIDSQLSKDIIPVGNCLGLTLLYNCLLRKAGLNAEALYVENAFGIGPHVLTILKAGELLVDIENIRPDGFDYKGHINDPSRTKWGDKELVADIYHSRANEYYEGGKYKDALRDYEKAIALSPYYEKARLNKAIVLDRISIIKKDN